MTIAAELTFLDGTKATFDEDLKWSHAESDVEKMLNEINTLIVDDYSVANGDRIIWFFEEVVEFLDPKESKLFYKIPARPKGGVVDG